ncbi:MAG: 2-hydroxyacyl-CoA dehydratase family protein [Deltaproteobacteria bacterium]|nr:2-hydroxyacyl-CoA dehydratase family protein [Deltaproteobacteria bacterium]
MKINPEPFEYLKWSANFLKLGYCLTALPRFAYWGMRLTRPFYVKGENFLNRKIRWSLLTLGGGVLPPEELKAYRYGMKTFIDNIENALKANTSGKPVVWVEWILSSEIVGAFDAMPFNPETLNLFGNMSGQDVPPMLIEEAENRGFATEYCSAIKLTAGAYMLEQSPQPAAIISGSHPCDTNVSAYQSIAHLTGAPVFYFDAPYWRDEDSFNYYEKSMWNLISFLEKNLHQKMNWDKLKQIVDNENKFNFYLHEICEMMRVAPSPATMITPLFAWVVRELAIGDPNGTEMARLMYEVVRDRYKKGIGVAKKENIRVLWWNPPIAFFTYVFKWMEDEFGAVVVKDFIGDVQAPQVDTSSEKTMIHDLARNHLFLAMARQCHGPVEFITQELEKSIEEYSPDCLIFAGHAGCKHGWGAIGIIKDLLKKRGLPSLFMNMDIMDQRHATEDDIKRWITEFFRSNGFV